MQNTDGPKVRTYGCRAARTGEVFAYTEPPVRGRCRASKELLVGHVRKVPADGSTTQPVMFTRPSLMRRSPRPDHLQLTNPDRYPISATPSSPTGSAVRGQNETAIAP